MKKLGDDPADRIPGSPRPVVPIWFATLGPPIAAILHLQAMYVFEHTACSLGTKVQLHVVTAILLILAIVAGLVARREWVRLGSEGPKQYPGPVGTQRLMALLGMTGTFIFGLFILAQWLPTLFLNECVRT